VSNRVMFVCAMNICRSPLLAATFARSLPQWLAPSYEARSRGTQVVRGSGMCETAASLLGHLDPEHVAMPADAASLRACDLILTATVRERAVLAQIGPGLRPRTFTVREAVVLGRLDEQPSWLPEPEPADGPVRRYAALLNARRGLASPASPRFRWPWRPREEPLDIPDVHLKGPREHLAGLRAAQRDARAIAEQIAAFTRTCSLMGDRG